MVGLKADWVTRTVPPRVKLFSRATAKKAARSFTLRELFMSAIHGNK
jgi:hypothetical protein